ncbi:14683_t:CDS:2, partial [Cetraspora pellucida]
NISEIQEISLSSTATDNVLKDKVEKNQEQNLRNSLNRLTINMLKVTKNVKKMRMGFDLKKGLQDSSKNRPFKNVNEIGYKSLNEVGYRDYK